MNFTSEQLEAINKDNCNIIVSAGAGSGKTAVLSERVIRKLKDGINIDELLILTFTNAAALEMKERIRQKIQKDPSLKEQLNILDSAYIGTFDSFSSSIVRKYNYLLNISSDFKIIDANLLNYQKKNILDELFNIEYEKNNPVLFKIISSYCDKDDNSIKEFIMNLDNKLNLLINKEEYLDKYLNDFFDNNKINKDVALYEARIINCIQNIKDNLIEFSKSASAKNTQVLTDYLNPLLNISSYDEVVKVDLGSKPGIRNLESETVFKDNIYKELDNIKKLCHFKNQEEIKESILSTYDFISFIIDIEKALSKQIDDYKYNNNLFEFNDIAKLAIKVIRDNKIVKEEITNSFKEIMIDEYQDTSDLQDEFISLIANNNVYMVGDIKQSIYRFRNANPYLFKEKYERYKNNDGGYKIDLTSNFRSRKEVINSINEIFLNLMTDNLGGADYTEHKMVYGNLSYDNYYDSDSNYNLEILNYNTDKDVKYKDNVIEAFIIAKDINNKITNNFKIFDKETKQYRQSTYKDFIILLDRSTSFELYKKIFEYFNIPLEICSDESIKDDTSFILLKNILNLIIKIKNQEEDNEFKYLMTSIMRSPLMEISDEVIFKMFVDNNFKENKLYKKCLKLVDYCDNTSISNLALKIIDEFNFYESLIKIGNVNNALAKIEHFLNNTQSFADIGYNLTKFIEYLNSVLDNENDIKINRSKENIDAVKVMTIHGSKGLEYPICYFAGMAVKTNRSDLNNRFVFEPNIGIIVPYDLDGIDQTIYKTFYEDKYLKEEISERIRLFYVALTRTREKMIIVTKNLESKIKDDMSSFNDFLAYIYPKIENIIKDVNLEELGLTKDYNLIKNNNYKDYISLSNVNLDVQEINIENEIIESKTFSKHHVTLIDEATKNNMEYGLKVHECLELIDLKNPNYNNIDNFLKNKIINMLNQDIFKNIQDAKIYKEYEFMYQDGSDMYHGIIDLMLVYEDHVDIIDYKLKNIADDDYYKQLMGYKKYIEHKLKKKTKIYLYSIMDNIISNLDDNML